MDGWGGTNGSGALITGGKYNPLTDTWTTTTTTNAPLGRYRHTAVWSGTEMIVWGGRNAAFSCFDLNTGGKYNPVTNSWTVITVTNAPSERESHTTVWTGNEMVVWGGHTYDCNPPFNQIPLGNGAKYNPGTDTWTATTNTNAPTARTYH